MRYIAKRMHIKGVSSLGLPGQWRAPCIQGASNFGLLRCNGATGCLYNQGISGLDSLDATGMQASAGATKGTIRVSKRTNTWVYPVDGLLRR